MITTFNVSCKSKGTTLQLALWDYVQLPVEKQLVASFMRLNPDIKVTIESIPWDAYFTKLEAAAQGGELPDVLWMSIPNFGRFASNGLLMPIDDQVKAAGIDLSIYVNAAIQAYTFDGKLYALPRDIDSMGLWYNKEIFDKAGIPYPTDDWKWNDLEKAGLTIKAKVKGVYACAFTYSSQNSWQNIINQNGITVLNADKTKSNWGSPQTIDAIKWMKRLIDIGVCPSAEESDLNTYEVFQSDKVAMCYAGSWCAFPFSQNEIVRNHIGMVEMPAGVRDATSSHSVGWVINAQTKYPEAAFKLVQYLGSKTSGEILAKTGIVIPAVKSAQQFWPEFFAKTFDVSSHVKALDNAFMVDCTRDNKWSILEEEGLNQVWSGKTDPAVACKDIAAKVDAALAAEK